MGIPQLETERLIVRQYRADDLAARHSLVAEAFGSTDDLEDTRRWLAWTLAGYRELDRLHQPPYGDYAVALRATGEVIGSVGLVPSRVPWDALTGKPSRLVSPEFGLFWAIRPAFQGSGYAPEAAGVLVDYAFSTLEVRRLVAMTEFDNRPSQRVMRKLGMAISRNPGPEPPWFQVIGVLDNPLSVR